MAKEFKSTLEKVYYIKSRKTKKGNTTYFLTTKLEETCLNNIPEGYEIYEDYSAKMLYLRKKKPSKFTKKEIAIIKKELKENKAIDGFELNVHGDLIKIYDLEDKSKDGLGFSAEKLESVRKYLMHYTENMRIKKITKKEQTQFIIMRYCYRGAIDDWIVIDEGDDLSILAERNLCHLGKDSFFDL